MELNKIDRGLLQIVTNLLTLEVNADLIDIDEDDDDEIDGGDGA